MDSCVNVDEVGFEQEVTDYLLMALKYSEKDPRSAMLQCRTATECMAHTLYFEEYDEYPPINKDGEYSSLPSVIKKIKHSMNRQTSEVLFSINAQSRGPLHWNFESRGNGVEKHHVEAVVKQISNSYTDLFGTDLNLENNQIDEELSSLLAPMEYQNHQLIPDADEYIRLGKEALDRGRNFAAESYYRDALKSFKSDSNLKGVAKVNLKLSFLLRQKQNFEEAKTKIIFALELYQELGFNNGIVDAYCAMGRLHYNLEDFNEAEFFCNKALEISTNKNLRKGTANAYDLLGDINNKRGKVDLALRYYQDELDIWRETGMKDQIALSLRMIANINRKKGNLDGAYDTLTESLKISKEIQSYAQIRKNLTSLGLIEERRGNLIQAEKYLFQVRILSQKLDLRNAEATALGNLAHIYIKNGELEKAEGVIKKSIEFFEENKLGKLGKNETLGVCQHNLGLIAMKRKQYTESRRMFEKSMKTHQNLPQRIAETLEQLAKLELELGNIEIAKDLQSQSLSMKRKMGIHFY